MNTKMKMRMLSILLCCVMLIGLLPTTALARDRDIIAVNSGNSLHMSVGAEGMLTWDAVNGATGYRVVVTRPNVTELNHWDVTNTAIPIITNMDGLKYDSGQYMFIVQPQGVSASSASMSYYYTSNVDQLESPHHLSWDGNTAKWDEVTGAATYNVALYNYDGQVTLQSTNSNSFDFSSFSPQDGWTFRVQAKPTASGTLSAKRDSSFAESPKKGAAERAIKAVNSGNALNMSIGAEGMLTWNAVAGATGYTVVLTRPNVMQLNSWDVNNNAIPIITYIDGLKYDSGQYTISVAAKGVSGGGSMSYYYTSNVDQLESPNGLSWSGTTATWTTVSGAATYNVALYNSNGQVTLQSTTNTSFDFSGFSPQDGWTFRVQAKPTASGTLSAKRDSSFTESPAYTTGYTVTYNANGGSGTMESQKLPIEDGFAKTYTFPTCTFTAPSGKVFDKWQWYYNNDPSNTNENAPNESPWLSGSITVKAIWKDLAAYTVTYDANGGTGTMISQTLTADGSGNASYTFPQCGFTAPSGKAFDKWQWYYESAPGSPAENTAGTTFTIHGNITVKALWKDIPTYTVTYDANGGTGAMESGTLTADNGVFVTTYTFPDCGFTAPSGKVFDKWQWYYESAPETLYEASPGNSPYISGSITVKALWKDITTYSVAYNANGGNGTMESQTLTADDSGFANYAFPNCGFTAPSGKEFDKWQWYYNSNPEATLENVPGNYRVIYGDITVKAIWKDTVVNYPGASDVSINGTDFSANAYYKNDDTTSFTGTSSDYNAWYDAASGTLHLNDFNGNFTSVSNKPGFIYCSSTYPLTIKLTGTNTLTATPTQSSIYGIRSSGDIMFTGSGSLTVTVTNEQSNSDNFAINSVDTVTVADSATLTVSVSGGSYAYGVYANNGVTITGSATVNATVNAKENSARARAIAVYSGAITMNSSNPTTITLQSTNIAYRSVGIFNWAGDSGTANNGKIILSGTGKVTINNTGEANAIGIISEPNNLTNNPSGVIALNSANVEITNCSEGIVGISQARGSAAADIQITGSTLTINSTKSGSVGVVSATNGVLISGGSVTISTYKNALSTYYGNSYTNTSAYGIDIAGAAVVSITGQDTSGTLLHGNADAVCDFNLASGGSVTIQHSGNTADNIMQLAYIKPGVNTATNGTEGDQHSTESSAHLYSKSDAALTFTYSGGAPTYSISLDKNGTHTFAAAEKGYSAQTPATVTVTNTGTGATGALTVALSGTDAASFTLSTTSINSIAAGGNDTFTVVPNTGLAAKTYTATVTVSGGNSISATFDVKFTVTAAPTYSIALDNPGTYNFAGAVAGYSAQTPATVTVTNTGTGATGPLTVALSGTDATSFTLSPSNIADIAVGGNATFTVVPNTGLAAKTYTATVTVSGGNSITASFNVSFTVTNTPTYSIALDKTGTHTFTAADAGYAAQTPATVTLTNTGTGATGPLTVALSGTDAASFTLSTANIADIAVGGNATFTVVPNTGLSAKTYTATVTVSGGNSITASFNVSFTVNPAGGGGGGGGYVPATYSLTVDKTENGSISVSPKSAAKGTTVTITVKPDEGYELDTLKVVDKNGNQVKLTEKDGKYTFTMPASKVTVTGTFVEIEQPMVNPFIDVKESDYFYEAVLWAFKNGITDGTSANTFSPNANCTRAQIVTFLWRAAGSPAPKSSENPFTDLKADAYYYDAVLWAAEQGITSGTGGGKFSPEAVCTRSQSVTLLYHATGSPKVSGNASFSDVEPNAYYAAAVAWAEQNGVTGGIGGGLFGSANDCTRGQIVTFLYRFCENIVK